MSREPLNDRIRPAGNGPDSNVISDGNSTQNSALDSVVRCIRCGHTLTAEKSVDLELGPVCRRVAGEVA